MAGDADLSAAAGRVADIVIDIIIVVVQAEMIHRTTGSGGQKTRFLLDTNQDHLYRLLLSAFLSGKNVRLAYSCRSGYPWIDGIRMR